MKITDIYDGISYNRDIEGYCYNVSFSSFEKSISTKFYFYKPFPYGISRSKFISSRPYLCAEWITSCVDDKTFVRTKSIEDYCDGEYDVIVSDVHNCCSTANNIDVKTR